MRWAAAGCGVTLAVLLAAPAATAAPTLTILAPEALEVHLSTAEGSGAATATIVVRNDADTPAGNVSFAAQGAHADDVQVTSDVHRVAPHTALTVPLTFASGAEGVSFSGVLVASADGAAADAVALTVDRAKPAAWWLWVVILAPFGAAAIVVAVGWRRHKQTHGESKLSDALGDATWDFQKSWASNLTVVGGILGAIVSSGALPEAKSATFAGLSLFFAVLALVAPFVYAATRRPVGTPPIYEGRVWSYLLSSTFTLWATFGQLATSYVLFRELRTAASLPDFAPWLLLAVTAASAALLVVYATNSITWTLDEQEHSDAEVRGAARASGWSLL
jgi:hypothetical protein